MRPDTPSYEVLLTRADRMLEKWGEHQRLEPLSDGGTMGYPSASVEARMMRDFGRRTGTDKRRRRFWRRNRRMVDIGGNPGTCPQCRQEAQKNPCEHCGHDARVLVPEVRMYPDRADKQSKGGPRRMQAWPQDIERLDRIVAGMPQPLYRVAWLYYCRELSIREGSEILGIAKTVFETRLGNVRWYVIGRLEDVDSEMSGHKDAI